MRSLGVSLVALLAIGCDQTSFEPPALGDDPPPGPGSPTWDEADLSCATDDDCSPGETCDAASSTCRPRQCDEGPYESATPLGPSRVLFREQELLVVDATANQGQYWVDGYNGNGTISYGGAAGGSFKIGTAALIDVAALHTPQGGAMVAARTGSTSVTITGRAVATRQLDVGFVPVAVATGDVDGDLVADVIALSATGQISVCAQDGGCQRFMFGNGETGADVATGDVDGDGLEEIVFLLRSGDSTRIAAWTVGAATVRAASFDTHFEAITAGDIDHDGRAEIAVLEDRGWFGWASDRVHLYRVGASFAGVTAIDTTGSAIDLAAGDLDGNDVGDNIVVLGENKAVDVLRWTGTAMTKAFSGSVGTTKAPRRIALGDLDDDSVTAQLTSGPELIAGNLMPTVVVTFPPYDSTLSDSAKSGVAVGNRVEMSESFTDTVALSAGVEMGVDADFVGLFKAKLSTKLGAEVSKSRSVQQRVAIGTKFSLRPQVQQYGNEYAAVVVACSCFHAYEYELVDPENRAGGTGRRMKLFVPVSGQTTVLSTPRYNALAAQVPGLPQITVPRRIGDLASYPSAPTKLDGTPVQPDEHVFPSRPTLRVSDVGTVGFSLSVAQSETNTVALKTSVSVSASLSAAGVQVGASLGAAWGKSHAITVGESSEFSGEIPPLPDDPSTQEDEYVTHGYSFSPYVYRQAYTDPVSNEATGYYVIDYAVSRR
ncbi:MAG: VCBS repeat-containing protein [Kofleriaceae bacterium]|nr:VCBS repeat-containing protein [Kofleriaceae bacterium]